MITALHVQMESKNRKFSTSHMHPKAFDLPTVTVAKEAMAISRCIGK